MLTNCLAACTHLSSTVSQLFEPQLQKNRRFHVPQPTFLFPLETPSCDYHAIRCMNGKTIQCLPNPSQHVLIYLQYFPSYTTLTSMRKSKNRYFYHIFVSPWDAPGAITLNVVWMEREFDAYKLFRSMYPSIFNTFPVIRTASAKNRRFHVLQPTFCFPWTMTQNVASMERQFNACQTPRSMYLSIFNSFRVILCLSQCVSPKIAIFTTFLFLLRTPPLAQSR